MAVEVSGACYLPWSHASISSHNPFSPKTLHLSFSIFSSDRGIANVHYRGYQLPIHGIDLLQHSYHRRNGRGGRGTFCNPNFDGSIDDDEDGVEFEEKMDELEFLMDAESRLNEDAEISNSNGTISNSTSPASDLVCTHSVLSSPENQAMPHNLDLVEQTASSFDPSLSIRALERMKTRWEAAVMNDAVCCSVSKAFSSVVFIIEVIQNYTIRMRDARFFSSKFQFQEILARVRDDLHASFTWLFQNVFSATPTLMLYLMILLANFTVFSITDYPIIKALPFQFTSAAIENSERPSDRFNIIGRSTVVGNSYHSGDGKGRRLVSGACNGSGPSLDNGRTSSPKIPPAAEVDEEYRKAWEEIVKEAKRIQANERHEALTDPNTLKRFVTPVSAELKSEDLLAYSTTEQSYREALAADPDSPLILSNFAQFLFLVHRDYDSAEEYFKRAAAAEPADAEALCRFANFLWVARGDIGAAEETFLKAIEAEPGNCYYSAKYANFLWSTGGDDTCYPLDASDE